MITRLGRRALVLGPLLLALTLAMAGPAHAHAVLKSTLPLRGTTVGEQPDEVVFRFSEPVESGFSAIRVYEPRGTQVDDGKVVHPNGHASELAVGLEPGLAKGTYTATFRVISADGHPVSGGFVFFIGKPSEGSVQSVAALAAAPGTPGAQTVAFAAARAIQYAAIALAIGAFVFLLTCWYRGLRAVAGAAPEWEGASRAFVSRIRIPLIGAVAAGVVSGAAGIVLQGAIAAGTSVWSAFRPSVVEKVLATHFGTIWGIRVLVWVALGALLAAAFARDWLPSLRPATVAATGLALRRPLARPWEPGLLLPALGFLAISPALAGHANAQEPTWVLLPANLLHVLAVSTWVGGLAVLLFVLPAATRQLVAPDRSRLLAAVVSRFSTIAGVAVALLLATGIAQSFFLVRTLDNAIDTAFGRTVLIKLGLLSALVVLGAYNRKLSVPRLQRIAARGEPPGRAGRMLRRAVGVEVAIALVVLGATGALAGFAPSTAIATGPFAKTQELGPAQLQLTIDPAKVGRNLMHLYLLNPDDGTQYDRVKELKVNLVLPDEITLPGAPRKAGPGHYVIDNGVFTTDGDWEVQIAARVSEFDAYYTAVEVRIR